MQIERLESCERAAVSDGVRTLLCDFAAGDLNRPLHRVEVDWEELFQGVCSNGLLGLTHRYLQHWDDAEYPPLDFRQQVRAANRASALGLAMLYRNIAPVLTRLTEADLEFLVIKGPALAYSVYPEPFLRSFNDLDVIVRECDWGQMHRRLLKLGFESDENWPEPPPKLMPLCVYRHMKYRNRELGLEVEVHYDDVLNAGLKSRDVEGFWHRAVTVKIEDVLVKTLSLEDNLIHLCGHVHRHGYERLNWLSDIALILRDRAAEIDWDRLLGVVQCEEANVGVYYTLLFLERFLGVEVPAHILNVLRPDRFRRWWHEYFLPEEKVLSLEPMWRPEFSFYHLPLFERTLPDLLVMGRRREKLHYILRLFTPPREWLRHYYGLSDTQNVAAHYVLHPLKLGVHYLTELVTQIFRGRSPESV